LTFGGASSKQPVIAGCRDAFQTCFTDQIGWTCSQADFARLGVGNVTVVNGPWQPRFLHSEATVEIIAVP